MDTTSEQFIAVVYSAIMRILNTYGPYHDVLSWVKANWSELPQSLRNSVVDHIKTMAYTRVFPSKLKEEHFLELLELEARLHE